MPEPIHEMLLLTTVHVPVIKVVVLEMKSNHRAVRLIQCTCVYRICHKVTGILTLSGSWKYCKEVKQWA